MLYSNEKKTWQKQVNLFLDLRNTPDTHNAFTTHLMVLYESKFRVPITCFI
jgi:hypothetical protein